MHRSLIRNTLLLLLTASGLVALDTEHLDGDVVPAPGPVKIDGNFTDWDLSNGFYICPDVKSQREVLGVWFHTMYDKDYFYVLARFDDPEPLNHPGSHEGSHPWEGDSLQMRFSHVKGGADRTGHWTIWRDRNKVEIVHVKYGRKFRGAEIKNALKQGVKMAIRIDADKKGYLKEIAIPWNLITLDKQPLKAGDRMILTVEPNYSAGPYGRISTKDLFSSTATLNKTFTFMNAPTWGPVRFLKEGRIKPRPLRLSNGQELPVALKDGIPVVDWSALEEESERFTGVVPIEFEMPFDGRASLNIRDAQGRVVRQLLTSHFFKKGRQTVEWDAMRNWSDKNPGALVPAGEYTWEAICHQGIGLKLRGWACHGGSAPWNNGKGTGWGGDHGIVSSVVSDGKKIYLGWGGAEAGRALVACDLEGRVQWRLASGKSNASPIAVDGDTVYAYSHRGHMIYRMDAEEGFYTPWKEKPRSELFLKGLFEEGEKHPKGIAAMDAADGKLFLAFNGPTVDCPVGAVMTVDADGGKRLALHPLSEPAAGIHAVAGDAVYVVAASGTVSRIDMKAGSTKRLFQGPKDALCVFRHADGRFFIGVGGNEHQVLIYDRNGKRIGAVGKASSGRKVGPFDPQAMMEPGSVLVDAKGRLWVTEKDFFPKRVSVWDVKTGKLLKEFYGPTHYGASGGAIHPGDPNVMVGEGCEWRLDPQTGRARCTYVIERSTHGHAAFRRGSNGRWYLIFLIGRHGTTGVRIYERSQDGRYHYRAMMGPKNPKARRSPLIIWADVDGDGKEADDEKREFADWLHLGGSNNWSINLGPDLTFYPCNLRTQAMLQLAPVGFTKCGAPIFDPAKAKTMQPQAKGKFNINYSGAAGNADGLRILVNQAGSGLGNPHDYIWRCFETNSGRLLWSYPNPYFQVHRSHYAPTPKTGLFRGAYGVVGVARLPNPVGTVWAINGNCGEWHLLTDKGYYLSKLFEGDPMKVVFPPRAIPGADMTSTPPGLGGEDFGGSMVQGLDGKVYVQAGKTGLWNLEVTGFDSVKAIPGGKLTVTAAHLKRATPLRETALQMASGQKMLTVKKQSRKLTGNFHRDGRGTRPVQFGKTAAGMVKSSLAWDEKHLYVSWLVMDNTPWQNGARRPADMYVSGDTVDLQLGLPGARGKRRHRQKGDVRVSIGPFKGKPTAVVYCEKADTKKPMSFTSGVVKNYTMDYVDVAPDVVIKHSVAKGQYHVSAAIPWSVLGVTPKSGMLLVGDVGATHGDKGGTRTRLRSYWNNQQTGLVDDAVFELQWNPKNWGKLVLK